MNEIHNLREQNKELQKRLDFMIEQNDKKQQVLDKIKEVIKKDRVYIAGERNLSHEIEELLEEIE